SSFELETQVILAYDLGYIGSKVIVTDFWNRIDEVQKMIDGFKKSLGK
ncbi:MAG: four helix bundle protein, partial [Saprospiraceae bacterium]